MADLINPDPEVFERRKDTRPKKAPGEAPDERDIFEHIRDIQDPEHPYSLEQLNVVQEGLISLDHTTRLCTCATTAGLCDTTLQTAVSVASSLELYARADSRPRCLNSCRPKC